MLALVGLTLDREESEKGSRDKEEAWGVMTTLISKAALYSPYLQRLL